MGIAFDVQEFWGLSDAKIALESALVPSSDPIAAFEGAFADYVGGLDAAFLVSGREAIYQGLKLVGVGSGDQVLLSAFNCSRVADAVLRCRAVPILVDIRLPGGEIDLDLVLQTLSPKVRAVIVPHLYGIPVDLRGIKEELEQQDIALIEDCAHCLGASVGGTPAGSQGSFSIFSFNTGKPMTLANGGMLVCSDPGELECFRCLKAQWKDQLSADPKGEYEYIERTMEAMTTMRRSARKGHPPKQPVAAKPKSWRPPAGHAGLWLYNRLRPALPLTHPFNEEFFAVGAVRAHLGLALLRRWPEIKEIRDRQAEYLRARIRQRPWGDIATVAANIEPAYYKVNLFAGELTAAQVEQAITRLRRAGFWAGRWPFLEDIPHLVGRFRGRSKLPNMRRMARHGLHLPIHQEMSDEDLDQMLDILYSVQP